MFFGSKALKYPYNIFTINCGFIEEYIEDQQVMLDVSLLDEANRQVVLEGKLETVQNMFYGAIGFSAVLAVALIVVGRKIWIK